LPDRLRVVPALGVDALLLDAKDRLAFRRKRKI
jgi:hypothetical protein